MLKQQKGVVVHIPLFLLLRLADSVVVDLLILQNAPLGQKIDKRSRLRGNPIFLLLIKRLIRAVLALTHFDSPLLYLSGGRRARVCDLFQTMLYSLHSCSHSYSSHNSNTEKDTRVL